MKKLVALLTLLSMIWITGIWIGCAEETNESDTDALDAKDRVQVQVLNGAPRRQAEELAAAALRWEGFKVVSVGPAERQDQALTRVLVYEGDVAAGVEVAEALGVPASAVEDLTGTQEPGPDQAVDVVVVLGTNYNPCR